MSSNRKDDWIPVTERMPDLHSKHCICDDILESDPVYITIRWNKKNVFYPLPCILRGNGYWYTDRNSILDSGVNLDDYDDGIDSPITADVVAWRPMPDPYRE